MGAALMAIAASILPNAHERRLIPEGRLAGPMPWVIAIMICLTMLAAAAGLALRTGAARVNADLAGRVTVQIVEANPDRRAAQAAAAVEVLNAQSIVTRVDPVAESDVAALLAPWLGAEGLETDIPLPALIDVSLNVAARSANLERLRAALAEAAPGARVDANGRWLRPVFDLLGTLQWLALGVVALLAVATAAVVILAARSSLRAHGETIAIMHLLGATDAQIARLFQRRIALDALFGGLVGGLVAVLAILAILSQAARLGSGLVDAAALGWPEWAVLGLIPLGGVLLALVTARRTVMRALGRTL